MADLYVIPPGWSWDIVVYFFLGGLTGGAYFLVCMHRLLHPSGDHRLDRLGAYFTFPIACVCGVLLIRDLGVPERFWHMLLQSHHAPTPMLKWWSPISFGAWILSPLASGFMLISFAHALSEGGVWPSKPLRTVTHALHSGRLRVVFLSCAALSGLALAGYTGMLVMVTNAPTWSHDPFLPATFMSSGVATGAATLFLLSRASGAGDRASQHRMLRAGTYALGLELLLVIGAVVVGHGGVSVFFIGWWGVLFWAVILPLGFIAPIVLLYLSGWGARERMAHAVVVGAVLLLTGGFLFRLLEVFGGQAYFRPY